MNNLNDIAELYQRYGAERYGGEAVNQMQHALQCAHLAQQAGSSPELITASFLHDIGHLVHQLGEDCAIRGIDDAHEVRGERVLKPFFPQSVVLPIALHVEAKRCLCTIDTSYYETLSPASVASMTLQGPRFSEGQVADFLALPYGQDALSLRRWDDLAKDPQAQTPSFEYFWTIVISTATNKALAGQASGGDHPPIAHWTTQSP